MKEEIRLILFTHGNLCFELLNVVKLILGEKVVIDSDIICLSNSELSLPSCIDLIRSKMKSIIDINNHSKFIVLTDLPGGSCFMASKKIEKEFEGLVSTISGSNISIITSFITKKKDQYINLFQFTELLRGDGIRAINF